MYVGLVLFLYNNKGVKFEYDIELLTKQSI